MKMRATTIIAVSHKGKLVFAGDGQVTLGEAVMKHGAKKVRVLQDGKVLIGFAGSAVDGITLVERFESKLQEFGGQTARAAVELGKAWRTDKYLRQLQAVLIVGDKEGIYLISGSGDVLQPDDGILVTGSGGNYALAAARALIKKSPELEAREIAQAAMEIAAEICIYTNNNIVIEEIGL